MQFEHDERMFSWGNRAGFLAGYFIFTTLLFYILSFTDKLPDSWNYSSIMGLTIIITLAGTAIKRL